MKRICNLILILCVTLSAFGQKIKTASGNLTVLAGEKELSVSFGYDTIQVHGYNSETEFLNDKVKRYEKKRAGLGEAFKKSWFANREDIYEPYFIKYINFNLPKKRKLSVSKNNAKAKYNLHVETLWVYPGYNVGATQPAKIEVALKIYEIANPEHIIWQSVSPTRIKGKSAPKKNGLRIGDSYTTLAMSMSWLLKKI